MIKDPEKRRAYMKKYRADNIEKIKTREQLYYLDNQDRIKKASAEYYQANKEKWVGYSINKILKED